MPNRLSPVLCLIAAMASIELVSTSLVTAQQADLATLRSLPEVIEIPVGVTRAETPISAFVTHDDLDIHVKKLRVLLVGGLDGSPHTAKTCVNVMRRFYSEPQFVPLHKAIALSVIPCGNPDGLALALRNDNGSGGDPSKGYPPIGDSYSSSTNPEAQYIWRWIGMHAPDTVIELVDAIPVENKLIEFLSGNQLPADCLVNQLSKLAACQVGSIDSYRVPVPAGNLTPFADIAKDLLAELKKSSEAADQSSFSKARIEMQVRDQRSALDVSGQLAKVYGHELTTVAYIPAVACIGRLRLAKITDDRNTVSEIEKLASDYLIGKKPTLNDKSSGSEIAGHLLFGELYDVTKNPEYIRLTLKAADRAFSADGKPLEAMPPHNEMSDAVFMGCPILAQAGRLTGDRRYFDMCLAHLRFMLKLNSRSDALHRHSPLHETAWGRGNGFPALGLALSLEDLPQDFAGRDEMRDAFRKHLTALLPHQDVTGAWHQVIDHPESFREMTCTCMITYAMTRGVRRGWLPKEQFASAIQRGWKAIKARIASDGSLVDVCTSTGKLRSLREYLDRTAILGRDPRGGAMALLVATEIAAWEKSLGE